MNKEQIGWRLKEEYKSVEKAAVKIAYNTVPEGEGWSELHSDILGCDFRINSQCETKLKEAGVLDLWFEPVYKEEECNVGDWVVMDCHGSHYIGLYERENHMSKWKLLCSADKSWGTGGIFSGFLRHATKEEIEAATKLTFGGHNVTLEKAKTGVRISCSGETGTLSQLEKIVKYFEPKQKKLPFGSVIVKEAVYSKTVWTTNHKHGAPKMITIGCTEGTWDELLNIVKAAREL